MNDIVRSFLLPGDEFMTEMHSRHPRFTYCLYYTK